MKKHKKTLKKRLSFMIFFLLVSLSVTYSQNLPFEIVNQSVFPDDQVYIALLGRVGEQSVWFDVTNGNINPINTSYNTVPGPNYGSPGPGGSSMYADCFKKLSDVPNSIIDLPQIASVRIFMSFNEQLYLYFFDDGGYSGPDLANETDPNQGIRFEIIELTYNDIGIWVNTTRVDHYQYPMGLEVWGANGFYKKVGEVLTHEEVLDAWRARVPQQFQICLDEENEIIHQPSKLPEFKEGGIYYDYFDNYVDQIWDRYMNEDLTIGIGDAGSWVGRVQGDGETFRFTRASDGRVAIVEARPNTQEIIEGKGVLAHDVPETPTADDLDVQKHFCAAFTRGVIDPNAPSGAGNDWSNEADFFQNNTYNEYVKFWHSRDISWEGETYAFCYDDVFDYSSTVHTTGPTQAKITIGGFANQATQVLTSMQINPVSATLKIGETQQFTVTGYDQNGNTMNVSPIWSSNAPNGLFTASSEGNYTISATQSAISASATVTVLVGGETLRVEAEDYINMSGVDTEACSEGGENVGWIDAGDWMDYSVTVSSAGTYDVDFRVAGAGVDTKTLQLSGGQNVDFAGTDGWQNWTTVSSTIDLVAGTQTIRLNAITGGFNINWIEFIGGAVVTPVLTSIQVAPSSVTLDLDQTFQFTATGYDQNGNVMAISPSWSGANSSGLFNATTAGDFTVTASVGTVNGSASVHVNDVVPPSDNLALGKPAYSSSVEGAYVADLAVDGIPDGGSRWASEYSDPQWIYVDLGQVYNIDRVYILWETAMGSDYQIQVSNDAINWNTVRTITGNTANENDNTGLGTSGRYVRIYGTARATGWGYSIFELEVYAGTGPTPVLTSISLFPESATLELDETQQFTATGYDQDNNVMSINPTWSSNAPNGLFTATTAGDFTVTASVGTVSGSASVNVNDVVPPTDNLALGKAAYSSSVEGAYVAGLAVDGIPDGGSRWSSEAADPQWIYVDLGQSYNIDRVAVTWETAMAADYQIQVSDDAVNWTTVRTVTGNATAVNNNTGLGTSGRYVRIYGTARTTIWGYSIFELEVYAGSGPVPVSIHVEAEDYIDMYGVDREITTDEGGGENIGWIDAGDWMDYSVDIPVAGMYTFTARAASPAGGGNLEVQVGGNTLGNVAIGATGGWQVWDEFSTTIALGQGVQTIRLNIAAGGFNLNWFEIDNEGTQPALSIPLHIEYAQYLRLGFSPADLTGLSELITQNTDRETTISYANGTSFTLSLIEKRRAEDVRFYTFNNGNRIDTIQGVPLTVTAYQGMEIFVDFIEDGPVEFDPVADAGENQLIDVSNTSCVSLDGSNSFDPDGTVVAYFWEQTEGPSTSSINNQNQAAIEACGLMEGIYVFKLTVTDNDGRTGSDIVQITVTRENADFALQAPANSSLITDNRRPQFTWENVAGTARYEVYVNVSREDYNWRASGNLLDRYTKVGESTTNSLTMPYDLVDRWTYKWYVLAIDGNNAVKVSNKQQFGIYQAYLEQEPDGINIVNGCRDMNKNGTIEPFENWRLTPEERLNDIMGRLSTEEKFKQSFYGSGEDPMNGFGFSYGVEHIMLDEQYQAAATPHGIPVAHAGDKAHGWKTIYPSELGLAATNDPNIAYQCGNLQRVEQKSFGFTGTLMPVAEVDTKVLYPRFQEGCGENADEASALIRAIICGLQGGPEMNPHSMLVTVKHWPSQGAGGEGPTQYDERTIGYHMKPWYAMVEANAASVMPGYSTSPFLDPTLAGSNSSKPIIDYLRDEIGFSGFIVTDWLAATTAQSIESMSAGIDVLGGAPSSGTDINELVAALGMNRLDEACRRVLNMKIRLGMFDNPYGDPTTSWTNEEHHAVALNAASKSITLIKNNGVLPLRLNAGDEIVVGGPRATWVNQDSDPNVIWQSIYYDNPQALNYYDAFVQRASSTGINVYGGTGDSPEVAVVVIGENAYTHGTEWADKDPDIPADQVNAIRDFVNRGIPVVTVVISPRPYVLTEVLDLSSAVMLVYRGGNGIAQATAELCFGDYLPSGKLPFQLPRSQDQVGTDDLNNQIEHWELPYDIGANDAERADIIYHMENNLPVPTTYGDPLYPYGWGLQDWGISNSYKDAGSEFADENSSLKENFEVGLYPNPVQDVLHVKISGIEGEGRYEIYTMSGELVLSGETDEEYFSIDMNILNLGMYVFRVSTGVNVNNRMFIKE